MKWGKNMKKRKRKPINVIKITPENYGFIKAICSKSGYSFHELYYVNANRYFTCIQVFDFMDNSTLGCLNGIIELSDTLVMMDISHLDKADYDEVMEKNIKSAGNEQEDSRKFMKFFRAKEQMNNLMVFNNYVDNTKDSIKLLTLRIYLFDKTKEALQDRFDIMINKLYRMKLTENYIQTNHLEADVKALTQFDNPIKKMVCGETIADFMAHSGVNIVDKNCALLGITTNGLYAPNYFSLKNSSFSTLIIGSMGSGKSACIKKVEKNRIMKGNHISYIFDIHGEYADFANQMEIPSVGISEKESINFFQMFYVEEEDGMIRRVDITNKIDEVTATFSEFNNLNRHDNATLIMQFEKLIRSFYEKYLDKNIEELTNGDWFTLSDIMQEFEQQANAKKRYKTIEESDLYVLELCLDKMIHEYGYLFDRKTTIDFDLNKSIRFDVSFLRNNPNKSLKSAYINLLLNYVSFGAYLNMKTNNRLMREQNIKIYELSEPLQTLNILIDETMEYADYAFLEKVNGIHKFLRKAYASFTFIIHGTSDFVKALSERGDLYSQLFSLCTNKIIGKIDGDSATKLIELIPEFSKQDEKIVTGFRKGANGERSFLVVDDQKRKTRITTLISRFERSFFGGGA